MTTVVCPSCGAQASGKFCRSCGTAIGEGPQCARCGHTLPATARFCASCGASTTPSGGASGNNERILWFGAGGLVAVLVGGLVLYAARGTSAPQAGAPGGDAPFASGAGPAAVPDISNMTPRERFDKLFDRIMRGAESGDAGTVERFAPMALSAYQMLEAKDVDSDARYHAALIRMHTGDVDGAAALADTILKKQPGHLFGIILRGTIARFKQDQKALAQSYTDFLAHYDAETKAKRPEYEAHPRAIEQFLKDARAARGQS